MAIRIRPATTLAVVLGIAFAFQLIATLSVPVTKTITLCTYDGYKFGVFGVCSNTSCSKATIGYGSDTSGEGTGFSLPSNARHSVSKLLIVHPIAAGFTFVSMIASIILHFHGPSVSLKLLFFLLLWTIPSFLLSLLAFLVDILLFVPHLDWGGWIVLAATVLIAISGISLCIMRRTVSSRKASKKNRGDEFGDKYQLEPLNYGYGTVDGDLKDPSIDDEDEERSLVPNNTSTIFDTPSQHNESQEALNQYQSTSMFDSMRDMHNHSSRATSVIRASPAMGTSDNNSILAPVSTAYRGGFELENRGTQPSLAYPSTFPLQTPEDLLEQHNASSSVLPYPIDDNFPTHSRYYNSTIGKPLGPRPMPTNNDASLLASEGADRSMNQSPNYEEEPSAPPQPEESSRNVQEINSRLAEASQELPTNDADSFEVSREPSYRTKIEQTINLLQGPSYSSDSINSSVSNLLQQKQLTTFTTVPEEDDDLYDLPQIRTDTGKGTGEDDVSSKYSSNVPSTIATPVDGSFGIKDTITRASTGPVNNQTEDSLLAVSEYPFPDPYQRRGTPAPSFSNESSTSSNFTSVSQRGINPRYLENHPEEQVEILRQQQQQSRLSSTPYETNIRPVQTRLRSMQPIQTSTDLLITSNPDFTINNPKRNRKKAGR